MQAALDELSEPVAIWVLGAPQAAAQEDLSTLLSLQPLLSLRHREPAVADSLLPQVHYPVYGMSLPTDDVPRGNRFIGFPTGFSLDAFVDELLALSRGIPQSSPLARETLSRLREPVTVRVFTSPG
ncbi:MAG: hypothetical protein M0Z66_11915 [Thermaerobacter sp.]|nr:hypothetical protein [Thermaerobacter sp.]